jgi:hypothetical protein
MSTRKLGFPLPAPGPRTMLEDFRAKVANNGSLDKEEVSDLKRKWGDIAVTPAQAQELRENLRGWLHQVQPGKAREELQKFIERDLPKLTVDTDARATAPRDFWGDLQTKAMGDGRVSKGDAKDLVKKWRAQPMSALEAQQLTQTLLNSTGTFDSPASARVVQRFLQDDLPMLVKDRENLPRRNFDDDLRVALMDDGHLDHGDVGDQIDRWKRELFNPDSARELNESVLRNMRHIDPGPARERMQHYLEKDLPRQVTGDVPRNPLHDVSIKMLDDGEVSEREARDLTQRWKQGTSTPAQGEAIRQAVAGAVADPRAANRLQHFVKNDLPRLVIDQALSNPNTAVLTWTPPFYKEDGVTPLDDLAGYIIEYGQRPGVHDHDPPVRITDASAIGGTVKDLTPGTWYFVVRAVNTQGQVSVPSEEVFKTVR